ncbi:MAG: class I SAM-dependent methyltransferase [Bacteroidetes bacterium]|nr:class I SAM-dependent methyltransferase [Bacteroidota bacterium]
MKFINIVNQAMKPSRGYTMIKKVFKRFLDKRGQLSKEDLNVWLKTNKISFEKIAINLNQDLWEESIEVSETIKANAAKRLSEIEFNLGGGGIYPLLTFLVRHLKPKVVVETGVAAGFSSYAILESMNHNKSGELFSSDFPYFRLPNPERFIGIIVPDNLKYNWSLYVEGDENNLPKIVSQIESIDIFHYDSDKSYSGRKYAFDIVEPKMKKNGLLIMDDIQDNSFFYDYITFKKINEYYIFEFEGKYVGLIGKLS